MKDTYTGKDVANLITATEHTEDAIKLKEMTRKQVCALDEIAFMCWLGTTIDAYAGYYNMSTEDTLKMMDILKEAQVQIHKELEPMEVSK